MLSATSTAKPFTELIARGLFRDSQRLDFQGDVLADDIEDQLSRFYSRGLGERPLLLDFASAEYIEVASLVNCIATIVDRTEHGRITAVGLPRIKSVRDFMRVWRFAEAVAEATGVAFEEFVPVEERQLLEEPQTTYTGIGGALDLLEFDPDWTPDSAATRNFFEFITLVHPDRQPIAPDTSFAAAPRKLSGRWTAPLIQQVLKRHMGDASPKDDVARVVVYEAVGNAIRHPGARVIQTTSKFDRKGRSQDRRAAGADSERADRSHCSSRPEGHLRICVWDDGASIASTLLPLVKEGCPIRAFALPSYMCERIFVQLRSYDGQTRREEVVDQSEDLAPDSAHEAHMLLASLYPGVSRSVAQSVGAVEPFDEQRSSEIEPLKPSAPGMGLYALVRTVLDQFQGTLLIRSGRYRLLIEVAHDAFRSQHNVRYKCKITQYPDSFPPFRGNLLTIQLPIKNPA